MKETALLPTPVNPGLIDPTVGGHCFSIFALESVHEGLYVLHPAIFAVAGGGSRIIRVNTAWSLPDPCRVIQFAFGLKDRF